MLKTTIIRFLLLWGGCLVLMLVLGGGVSIPGRLLIGTGLSFFCYSFSWARGALGRLGSFVGRYSLIALLFGSIPAITLAVVIFLVAFPLICLAGIVLGAIRLAANICQAARMDGSASGNGHTMNLW